MNNIWGSIESALLVVKFNELDELKIFREAMRDAGLNVNNCVIMAVVDTKKKREVLSSHTLAVFISEQDFNILGQLKNDLAIKQLKRKFDVIINIGDIPKKLRKQLSKLKSPLTIGLNCTNNDQDVNLSTDSTSPKHLINFAKNTLEKIS